MAKISTCRVYDMADKDAPAGTEMYLVDRMWPRGIRKDQLPVDGWLRDVAPSTALRRWFGHEPERFAEFRTRYRHELEADPPGMRTLLDAVRRAPVILLYAARDTEHNQAVVLREYVLGQVGQGS